MDMKARRKARRLVRDRRSRDEMEMWQHFLAAVESSPSTSMWEDVAIPTEAGTAEEETGVEE